MQMHKTEKLLRFTYIQDKLETIIINSPGI